MREIKFRGLALILLATLISCNRCDIVAHRGDMVYLKADTTITGTLQIEDSGIFSEDKYYIRAKGSELTRVFYGEYKKVGCN